MPLYIWIALAIAVGAAGTACGIALGQWAVGTSGRR